MGCITASLFGGVLVIYWIKKGGRKGRKKSTETFELDPPMSQNTFDDQHLYEMPAEEEPKEIMNNRNDRTELPDSQTRPPIELKA